MSLLYSSSRASFGPRWARTVWGRGSRQVNSILYRHVSSTRGDPSSGETSLNERPSDEDNAAKFAQLLEDMKCRFLPTDEGLWDTFNIQALRKTLQSHLSLPDFERPDDVPPGYHQVSFNSLPYESELGHDGAEQIHAPNEDWKFRVWAGGYLDFRLPYMSTSVAGQVMPVAVKEAITDTRLLGNLGDKEAKVMVTLTRTLIKPELDSSGALIRGSKGGIATMKAKNKALIKEEKYLCFMREIPESLKSSSSHRIVMPPKSPFYSQSMVPSPTLLFRFSALTRNAHAIHLDAEYTRQAYGLRKPLVHGPLTSVLMLDVLGRALALHGLGGPHRFAIRTFHYRNLLPLFVNEEITISCKKLHNITPTGTKFFNSIGEWEKWEVWIQKGNGKDETLAVRGTAEVSPVLDRAREAADMDFGQPSARSSGGLPYEGCKRPQGIGMAINTQAKT